MLEKGDRWELTLSERLDRLAAKMGLGFHILRIALSISALVTVARLLHAYWS